MVTWRELRIETAGRLRAAGVDTADAEARWIIEEVSGLEGAELIVEEGEPATQRGVVQLDQLLARRLGGEPIQYVLGHWNFRGLDLLVDPRVLIPRPETEFVVELALEEAVRAGAMRGTSDPWGADVIAHHVADLGTGSGAIALALATELPTANVWAVDASPDAVMVARSNVAGVGSAGVRVRVLEGSWFDALPSELRGQLSLIVSNPPYVTADEYDALPPEVRDFEPRRALVSGPSGLEAIEVIVRAAPEWLTPNGAIVIELAPHQAAAASELARSCGFGSVEVRVDLAGRDRALVARP